MPVWVEIMLWISEAITFPVVLLVLVVTVLFLFRKEIAVRVKHSSFEVGKFSVSAPQQSNPPEVPEAVEVPEAARLEHQREIENAAEREQALRQALWESQLETYFEITYRVIFASQMRVLKLLNESPTGFRQDALRLLAPAAITASGAALERWSQYFLTSSLAVVQDQNIVISEPGRNFLLYVTRQGYPELGPNTQW